MLDLRINNTVPTSTSILVTWVHSLGTSGLLSYVVLAEYLGPCQGVTIPTHQITITSLMTRSYTFSVLEEYSQYNVSVQAIYSGGANMTVSATVSTEATCMSDVTLCIMVEDN